METILAFASFKLILLNPLISALSHCFKETVLFIVGSSKTSIKKDVFAKQVVFNLFSTLA